MNSRSNTHLADRDEDKSARTSQVTTKSLRVLVVEDNDDIRELVCAVLASEGYEVEGKSNGREALDALELGDRPSLILLDLRMPVMTGRELLAALGRDASLAAIPVIITTADNDLAGLRGRKILRKPSTPEEILDAVDEVFGRTQRSVAVG